MPLAYQIVLSLLIFMIIGREICHRIAGATYSRWQVGSWFGVDLSVVGLSVVLASASFDNRSETLYFYSSILIGIVLCLTAYTLVLTAQPGRFKALDGRAMSGMAMSLGVGTSIFLSGLWWADWFVSSGRTALLVGVIVSALPLLMFLCTQACRIYFEVRATHDDPQLRAEMVNLRSLIRARRQGTILPKCVKPARADLNGILKEIEALLQLQYSKRLEWMARVPRLVLEDTYRQIDILRSFRSALDGDGWSKNAVAGLVNEARNGNRDARFALIIVREHSNDEVVRENVERQVGQIAWVDS